MNYRKTFVLALTSVVLALSCGPGGEPPADCGAGRVCDCEPGEPDCSPCQPGYRPALVGDACVPTCNAATIDCGAHGQCEETGQGAECRCDPGYTGTSCSGCASGLSANASGQCVGELSAPALLTLSSIDEEVVLGTLKPPLWNFLPLVSVSSTVTDVAYDSATEDVYVLDEGRLFLVDLDTGEKTGLTAVGVDLGSALCLDAAGRRIFTASAEAVHEIELERFETTEIAAFGARALEYDAERGLVIGVDEAGATFELSGSAPSPVGEAPELDSLAMAFDAEAGRAYFLGSETETGEERLLRYCGSALARLGAVPAWQARVALEVPPGAGPFTLDYEGADSALVAVDLDAAGVDAVRVTAPHPDAALCLVADGVSTTELEIEVTADARAGFILVVAPARRVSLDVSALGSEISSSIVIYTGDGLTIAGPSAGVSEYEDQAWGNLGLTTLAAFDALPAPQLVLMDWASQATLPLELEHQLVGTALAWVGEGR